MGTDLSVRFLEVISKMQPSNRMCLLHDAVMVSLDVSLGVELEHTFFGNLGKPRVNYCGDKHTVTSLTYSMVIYTQTCGNISLRAYINLYN